MTYYKKAISDNEIAFALGILLGSIVSILFIGANLFNVCCISGCIILLAIGMMERYL